MKPPKFSIITPTILRATADRTMASVDAQTSDDYEHIVIVDGLYPQSAIVHARWKSKLRRFIGLATRYNDCGATPRNIGVQEARGEFIVYLDDDDYYVPDAIETLGCLVGAGSFAGEDFGIFPILMGGARWLQLPPGRCRTASCQIYHRRVIGDEVIAMPPDQKVYSDESAWMGVLAERFGYRVLDCHELVIVERGHNSSNLPGGPPMMELPQIK